MTITIAALHNQAPFSTFEWHAASSDRKRATVGRLLSRDQVSVKRKEPAGIRRLAVSLRDSPIRYTDASNVLNGLNALNASIRSLSRRETRNLRI